MLTSIVQRPFDCFDWDEKIARNKAEETIFDSMLSPVSETSGKLSPFCPILSDKLEDADVFMAIPFTSVFLYWIQVQILIV